MTDDEEKALRQALLGLDVHLRRTQTVWETPRNIAILFGVLAALVTSMVGFAGFVGFRIGQASPTPPIIIQVPK
jgi:hypothetical protein